MNLNKQLQTRLKALMEQEKLLDTQRRVAVASGVAQSSINRILNNTQSATLDMVSSLAKAFRIKPDRYFLLEEEEAQLLNLFNSLDANERRRCLKWLVKIVEAKKTGAVDFLFSDSLPEELEAAVFVEASKPLGSKGNIFDEQTTTKAIPSTPRKSTTDRV
ncbi:helix-turn-helix transcriptional regulator [Limnobacter sp.]|uniref:helix-turn-helix domain-containing protein n=1 Tax=Limnobacter sp. TaxID=2003368 RepID=UPI00311E8C4C